MKFPSVSLAISGLFLLLFHAHPAAADDWDSDFFKADNFEGHSGDLSRNHWQLMLSPGYTILLNKNYQGISYSNSPSMNSGLYYQTLSWCQLGVEGGYSWGHTYTNTLFSFDGIDFATTDRLELAHITPTIKLGFWTPGPLDWNWRPFVQAGGGWYQILHRTNVNISDNQGFAAIQIDQSTRVFLGANVGVGVEAEIYPQGVVGVNVIYQEVFSSENLKAITPGLQFSYLF